MGRPSRAARNDFANWTSVIVSVFSQDELDNRFDRLVVKEETPNVVMSMQAKAQQPKLAIDCLYDTLRRRTATTPHPDPPKMHLGGWAVWWLVPFFCQWVQAYRAYRSLSRRKKSFGGNPIFPAIAILAKKACKSSGVKVQQNTFFSRRTFLFSHTTSTIPLQHTYLYLP